MKLSEVYTPPFRYIEIGRIVDANSKVVFVTTDLYSRAYYKSGKDGIAPADRPNIASAFETEIVNLVLDALNKRVDEESVSGQG
ncbi:hypothetical protein [uncultured Sphaerochaeta sp.]|uniref:hypothetical protein n=1 Tax=uncultured Sphaerochaeta sp. TaxID=886478 RepID=UPI00262F23A8|nr:hypothetical protein [uncultured Sphaerochaeta sp.]